MITNQHDTMTSRMVKPMIRFSGQDPLTPVITEQPQDQTVTVGATPTFSTLATVESGELSYQWQEDDGAGFANIAGATSPTLNLGIVTALANGKLIRAQVTANGRSVLSITVTLTVTL